MNRRTVQTNKYWHSNSFCHILCKGNGMMGHDDTKSFYGFLLVFHWLVTRDKLLYVPTVLLVHYRKPCYSGLRYSGLYFQLIGKVTALVGQN